MHVILVVIQVEPSDTSDEYNERNPIQLKADEEYFELLELFCEVHEGKRGSPRWGLFYGTERNETE